MDNPFSFQWNEMQTLGSQTIHDDDAAQFQGVQMEDTSMDPIDTNLLGPTAPSGIGAMGNNDYMLFLNLATPTSTTAVDELHAREKEEMEQSHLDVPDDNAAYCKVGGPAPPPCTGGDATDGPEADGEAGAEHARARENVRVHHEDPQNHNSSNTADHAHDGPYSNDSNDIDTGKDLADVALMPKFDFADAVISETQLELIINSSANHPKKQQHVRNTPHLSYSVSNPIPSTCDRSRINSVEFTPLLSPMINPSLERINSNKGKTGFSPLSSPVLEFKKYNHASTLRQKRKEGPNEKFNSSFDVSHSNNNNNNNNSSSSSNNNSNSKNSDNNNDNHQNPDNDSESVNNPNKTRANVKSDKYSWHIENNSSDTFNNMNDDDSDNRSFKRSKTPVTTPLLTATDPRRQKSITSKNSSNSPSLTAQSTPFQNYVFKQRQFNNLNSNSNSKEPPVSTTSVHPDFTNNSFLDAFEGDLTLPPPPNSTSTASATNISPTTAITGAAAGNNDFSCFQSLNSRSSDPSVATPATLMSLNSTPNMYPTKPRKSNVLLNPNHHKSAQSSPVILPSSSIALDLPKLEFKMVSSSEMKPFSGSSSAATPNIKPNANLKNPSNFGIGVGTSILDSKPQTSLSTPSNSSSSFSTQHYHSDKKMSHKLAEQGRRNRMNIAIQELDKLIPESMKRDITVPSKATTVELGCKYILELLELLHNSQKRPTSSPGPHSHPDPNPNPHINSNSTSGSAVESISPLDGMDSNDRP